MFSELVGISSLAQPPTKQMQFLQSANASFPEFQVVAFFNIFDTRHELLYFNLQTRLFLNDSKSAVA